MSKKISSGLALGLIFAIAGTIGLLLWLGNEREMRTDDPRFFNFEKPGGNQNWLEDKNGENNNEEELGDRNFCTMETKECLGGYFVGRNADDNCEFYPCPEEGSENAQNEINTSNWKTYRNEEYGFEFRYPKELTYNELGGIHPYIKNLVFSNLHASFDLGIMKGGDSSFFKSSSPDGKVTYWELGSDVLIKGNAVRKIVYKDEFEHEILWYVFDNGKKSVVFSRSGLPRGVSVDKYMEDNFPSFLIIISTFKFTE